MPASSTTKRKRPTTRSATRQPPVHGKRQGADTPLINGSHVSGFIVGLTTGAIASLGIVAGVNPSALPQPLAPQQAPAQVTDNVRQPIFTFFTALADDVSATNEEATTVAPSEYTQFVLQAGSFRAFDDADRRRGELALLGLEASIENITTDTGVWHRIYIGPFDSRSAMAKARSLTAQSDIDTLLLKRSP